MAYSLKTLAWRLDLRTARFMDKEPDPDDVPSALRKVIDAHWAELREAWDAMYPENQVETAEDEESSDE